MIADRTAILVRAGDDAWEASRTGLALAMDGMAVELYLWGAEVSLPPNRDDEDFLETLEMIEDMGGEIFSDLEANRRRFDPVRPVTVGEMSARLANCDLVIPF